MRDERGVRVHCAWVVLGTVSLMLLAASGLRASFGVFILPLETEFGVSPAPIG